MTHPMVPTIGALHCIRRAFDRACDVDLVAPENRRTVDGPDRCCDHHRYGLLTRSVPAIGAYPERGTRGQDGQRLSAAAT